MTRSQAILEEETSRMLSKFMERSEKMIQHKDFFRSLTVKEGISTILMPSLGSRKQFFEGESLIITDVNGFKFLL